MMSVKFLLPFLILVSGCVPRLSSEIQNTHTFTDYEILNLPQTNLPLGARWLNDNSSDGYGLSKDFLREQDSIQFYELSKKNQIEVVASFQRWLGLSSNFNKNSKITFSNLTIVTIQRLADVPFEPEQSYVYSALKAKEITIETDIENLTELTAASHAARVQADAVVSNNGRAKLILRGQDLFFGYKLIHFLKPVVREKVVKVDREKNIKIENYEFNFDARELTNCMCDGQKILTPISQNRKQYCYSTTPIEVVVSNLNVGSISEGGRVDKFNYYLDHITPKSKILNRRSIKNNLVVDRFIIDASIASNTCLFIQGSVFSKDSKITLQNVRYPFKIGS